MTHVVAAGIFFISNLERDRGREGGKEGSKKESKEREKEREKEKEKKASSRILQIKFASGTD